MSTDAERKEQTRLKSKEYEQREHRKEKSRHESSERCRQKKLLSTASRFSEHDLEELLVIAMLRCRELGIDYTANEHVLVTAMRLLHGPENDQSGRANSSITEPQANQTTAQETRAS